jgi:hypothetical protein
MKAIKLVFKILLFGCSLYVATFYSYVVRTKIKVGYFPYMNHPDIVQSTSQSHYDFVLLMFFIMLLTYSLSLILFLFFKWKKERLPFWSQGLFITNTVFLFFHFFIDPFLLWFAD